MDNNPLKSLSAYSEFVARAVDRPTIMHSTVATWSDSPYTGIAEGEILFSHQIRLRIREELDFDAGLIVSYSYEVYRGAEQL